MHRAQFSFEPPMQAVDTLDRTCDVRGVFFRSCTSPRFEQRTFEFNQMALQSLGLGSGIGRLDRIVGLDTLRLQGPSYSVLDGGKSLLLTYVLRHSPGALRWRNGWGGTSYLEPGAMFINQGQQDSVIEISPAMRDEHCDCVRVVLRSDSVGDLALRIEGHDFPFCNSPEACVRIMLGSYNQQVAQAALASNLSMLDIDIAPLSEIRIPVANDHLALAILTSGSLESDGVPVEPWHAVVFNGHEPLARLSTQSGASVLWFGIPHQATPAGFYAGCFGSP